MVTRDVYLQPEAPDPVLDADTVLTLVRRHVPEARAVTSVDESGGEARAYAIDADVIVKTQRPHRLRPRTSLAKEVFFLNQLVADKTLAVPRVLGYGRDGSIEYICMTRIPGIALRHATLTPDQRAAVLRDLGRTLRGMHARPLPPFVASRLFPGDRTADDLAQRLQAAFSVVIDALREMPEAWPLADIQPEAVMQRALAAVPHAAAFAALHSNPGPEHVFVDPERGTFAGLIDFGDAYISHPALDLRPWRARPDREALLAGYCRETAAATEFKMMALVAALLGEMGMLARRRQAREQAAVNLRELLEGL